MIKNRQVSILILVLFTASAFWFFLRYQGSPPIPLPLPNPVTSPSAKANNQTTARVMSVIDGDTIIIEGGRFVRYIGIDAPEEEHENKPAECFAAEATTKNRELVEGKVVRLEKDVSDADKYGRLLRYVWIEDFFVNQDLVKEGFARIMPVPPDIKYRVVFQDKQNKAIANQKGMWNNTCRYRFQTEK